MSQGLHEAGWSSLRSLLAEVTSPEEPQPHPTSFSNHSLLFLLGIEDDLKFVCVLLSGRLQTPAPEGTALMTSSAQNSPDTEKMLRKHSLLSKAIQRLTVSADCLPARGFHVCIH